MYSIQLHSCLRFIVPLIFLFVFTGCDSAQDENKQSGEFSYNDNTISVSSELAKNIPWDLKDLSNPPEFEWIQTKDRIRPLLYEGPPYNNKKTSVFAYYTTPGLLSGDPSKDNNLPAIVLLHGGWAHADQGWVASGHSGDMRLFQWIWTDAGLTLKGLQMQVHPAKNI